MGKLQRLSAEQVQESLTSFEGYKEEDANRLCDVISAFLHGGNGDGSGSGGSGSSVGGSCVGGVLMPREGG